MKTLSFFPANEKIYFCVIESRIFSPIEWKTHSQVSFRIENISRLSYVFAEFLGWRTFRSQIVKEKKTSLKINLMTLLKNLSSYKQVKVNIVVCQE